MNRCTKSPNAGAFFLCVALLGFAFVLPSREATAQAMVRSVPKDVKYGRIVVTAPPEITLDGKADRLSPGARLRGTNNLLLLSGSVVGQTLPVVYRRDVSGLVHEVWILAPDEDAKLAGNDSEQGNKRFSELLDLIFGARR